MKVLLTMEFDIPEHMYRDDEEDIDIKPEDLTNHQLGFVKECIGRQFLGYAECKHRSDAILFASENSLLKDEIVEHHKEWANIIKNANNTSKIELT